MSDLVTWSPAMGEPERVADGGLHSDGKMRLRVGTLEVPLAMHDGVAIDLLSRLDVGSVAEAGIRRDTGEWMPL